MLKDFRRSLFWGSIFLVLLLLQGCDAAPLEPVHFGATPALRLTAQSLSTPIPAFVATDQASALQARATIQAGEGRLAELAAESTAVALQMTASSATEAQFGAQTVQSQALTATAGKSASDATGTVIAASATAQAAALTATRQAQFESGTATQQAQSEAVSATQTQSALAVIQASAQAEIERIREQRESERQTRLWRTWAWRLLSGLALLGVVAILLWSLWAFRRLIAARLLVVRWGRHGKPFIPVPAPDGGVSLVDISRSGAPVIHLLPSGSASVHGLVDNAAIQNQTVARAQAGELLLAANTTAGGETPGRRSNPGRMISQPGSLSPLAAPAQAVNIEVIEPGQVRPWLDEVSQKLLDSGEEVL